MAVRPLRSLLLAVDLHRRGLCALAASLLGLGATPVAAQDEVTYSRDIAPILDRRCGACHRPEGSAPFSLLTHGDAARRARTILEVVERGLMPPWPPLPAHGGPFLGERRLTDSEKQLLAAWVEAGRPEGDPARRPVPPVFPVGWQLGEPDLVVEASEAFLLPAEGRDVYRNLVLPLPVDATRYVRALELLPGNPRIVHHAVMLVDRSGSARAQDRDDPGPGFGGMSLGRAEVPDGHFLAWAPGREPDPGRPGLAWTLDPGLDLVLQLHLRPSGKPESIRPRVGLYFAEEPPREKPFALTLASLEIDIPAGVADYVARADYVLPVDLRVLSIFPHTHYLGRDLRAFVEGPDGARTWLLRIDPWDFDWQDAYRYVDPVLLRAGSRVVMEYHYDNSAANPANPHVPPERVGYGEQSSDEMGELLLEVLPVDPAERPRLRADFGRHRSQQTLAWFRACVGRDPEDLAARKSLAFHCLRLGLATEARRHFEVIVRARPRDPEAHNDLGNALLVAGQAAAARAAFEQGLELAPLDVGLRTNLGVACFQLGQLTPAREALEYALAQDADLPKALLFLGGVLARQGESEAAGRMLERVLQLAPAESRAHRWLADLARRRGDEAEALRHDELARALEPQR